MQQIILEYKRLYMVLFDLLRISDDGKRMYVDFHVNGADYFKKLTLDSMVIMTADQVSETDPLTPTTEYIYKMDFPDGMREYSTVLVPAEMNENFTKNNFSTDLFFVYVICKGTPDPCTPCGLDDATTLGVTFDENLLHQKVLGYTRMLADTCNIPQAFIDFILTWYGFKAAIETEHPIMAIKYYNMLFGFGDIDTDTYNKGCGCHGEIIV